MKGISLFHVGLLGAALALGFALGLQARTALAIRGHLHLLPANVQELGFALRQQEIRQKALAERLHELQRQAVLYEQMLATQQPTLKRLTARLARLRTLAGLMEMGGPGVMVEMADNPQPLPPGQDPNEVILHNYDVVWVVNDLFAGGAEAVSVNGERIVPNTSIKSVATIMLVNTTRISPPLKIFAIGDTDRLEGFLWRSNSHLRLLQAFGFPVRVTRARRLRVPPYKGSFTLRQMESPPGGRR